ncbi:TonB-dependent receptor [Niabella terrae]
MAQLQPATIRGNVIDNASGEPLKSVTVKIAGRSQALSTDLEGSFSFTLPAGTYTLELSYVSYQSMTIQDISATPGQVTLLTDLRLQPAVRQIEAVVVTARQTRNSEAAIYTIKRRSPAMMDGISADKMRLAGDATAGAAAKRVTGVTVEEGKYVYVRGLGDRYSKTTLNGMEIPGLDPDRNSLQMDIFPAAMIDNIMVSKNFVADLPADFTGGAMNIELKDFPSRKTFGISVGLSVNPDMHFNSNYLSYSGGKTDFLGIDDGTRQLPAGARGTIPSPTSGHSTAQITNFIGRFNKTLGATPTTSLFDYDFSISWGNQVRLKGNKSRHLGYLISASYKNETRLFNDIIYGEYQKDADPEVYELNAATLQQGQVGEQSALLGLLGGLAYKTENSKLRLTAMHLQNGISRAGRFDIENTGAAVGTSGYRAQSNNLEYNQRSLTNLFLNGDHRFPNPDWELDWRISPTYSISNDPDIRKTAFTYDPGKTWFSAGAGGNPSRIWRYLNELNLSSRIDLTKKYSFRERAAKLKFGFSNLYKNRDYEILSYDLQFFQPQDWSQIQYDPNQVLSESFIYPNSPNGAYFVSGNNSPNPNEFQSSILNTAAYVSNELPVTEKLRAILGLRAEQYTQRHTGRDQNYANGNTVQGLNLNNAKVLNSFKLFPTLNLIYALRANQNLRLSYGRTIARPSFKEMSFAQILDPISNRIFNGSLLAYPGEWEGSLKETDINNFDARWELFLPGTQIFSVSAFAKTFKNPIELVRIYTQQTSTEYQARNVGSGILAGAELEFRKNFDFISETFRSLSLSGNFTYVYSKIDMTHTEYQARNGNYKKTGESVKKDRAMAGQAPWVINAGLSYNNIDHGIDAGLFYNVKGPVLWIVGGSLFPDVCQLPFHSLNLSIGKKIGERFNMDLKISNLLNQRAQKVYRSYQAADQPFETYRPGSAFGLGLSYSL